MGMPMDRFQMFFSLSREYNRFVARNSSLLTYNLDVPLLPKFAVVAGDKSSDLMDSGICRA
jgi:hypothetical protein